MSLKLKRISYSDDLNARQKENFNFQKVSAVLADYGFVTIRLSDDWQGADFIALHHKDGETLRVQLKGRLTVAQKYKGKGLHITFFTKDHWYLCLHDKLLDLVLKNTKISETRSWKENEEYSFPRPSRSLFKLIEKYKITGDVKAIEESQA